MTLDGLRLQDVTAGYGQTTVLRQASLSVPTGSVVALLGSNGAGKTTLLRAVAGLLRPTGGQITLDGEDITSEAPHRRTRRGLCLIPEGRGIWRSLTVRENLRLQGPPWLPHPDLALALDVFPALKDKLDRPAGQLSGGQQQMVALSRAFLAEPQVVLLDEVSMGLAPIVVDEIFEGLRALADRGTALLLVEQYVDRALAIADHAYVLTHGRIVFDGSADALDHGQVARHYLTDLAVEP